jgi:hypothetical protein
MDVKKHRAKWEGIHQLKIKHEIFDSGNPLTGLNDSPVPRIGPRPLVAATEKFIEFHAAYCGDKEYNRPIITRIIVYPNKRYVVKVPRTLIIPEKDVEDPLSEEYPLDEI